MEEGGLCGRGGVMWKRGGLCERGGVMWKRGVVWKFACNLILGIKLLRAMGHTNCELNVDLCFVAGSCLMVCF